MTMTLWINVEYFVEFPPSVWTCLIFSHDEMEVLHLGAE